MIFSELIGKNVPEMILNPRINLSSISKKAIVLKWFLTNKRVVPMLGARQAAMMMQYMQNYRYNASSYKYPVLVHLGSDDKVVDNEVTKKIYEKFTSPEKQMFEYEGAYHELQFEDCSREMLKNTFNWMNQLLKEGNSPKLGVIDFDKIKVAMLKKKAPFKHWKALITTLVIVYYLIGYLLMVTKFVNKDRHEMLALWPCQVWRRFFGKR